MFSGFSFKKHIFPFVLSFLITVLILSAVSIIFSFFPPSEKILNLFSRYSYLLSGFIAAFLTARFSTKRGFLTGIVASDIYIAMLLALGTLMFGGVTDISSLIRIFALSSLCGAVGGIIGINCK